MLAASVGSSAGAPPSSGGSVVVPLHVERGRYGETHLGIDVMIGERTARVVFDTGSTGLRVLASAAGTVRRTTRGVVGRFDSGLALSGREAMASFAIGTARSKTTTSLELIDSYGCTPQSPSCPFAKRRRPAMFGAPFAGILGVNRIDPPSGRCCPNPLRGLAGGLGLRYIVHANAAAPTLTLGAKLASPSGYTMLDVPRGMAPRGCIRLSTASNDVCGDVVFDTASPDFAITTTGAAVEAPLPPGTTATLTIGPWMYAFTLGNGTRLSAFVRRGNRSRIVVGLAELQSVDVFYDLDAGRIGLSAPLSP